MDYSSLDRLILELTLNQIDRAGYRAGSRLKGLFHQIRLNIFIEYISKIIAIFF